jgi:hypothetical protein
MHLSGQELLATLSADATDSTLDVDGIFIPSVPWSLGDLFVLLIACGLLLIAMSHGAAAL